MKRFQTLGLLTILLTLGSILWAAIPQLINFQGILRDGSGNPVTNGSYSVTFRIYDASVGGNMLWTETRLVTTSSGLFTVFLGAATPLPDSVFNDSSRYLGIAVSPDPEMTPRQKLVSVPFSIGSWSTTGNGATNPGRNFLGTLDNQALELKVNDRRALRIEPTTSTESPNLIGGHENNTATPGTIGATISGGGGYFTNQNHVTGHYGTIGGGAGNEVDFQATVGGGGGNVASGSQSTIAGGQLNRASGGISTVGGGQTNLAGGPASTVAGGAADSATALAATVGGGNQNVAGGAYSTVAGGYQNRAEAANSSIGGGVANKAGDGYSTVAGGIGNSATGNSATVSGGNFNIADGLQATIGGGVNNMAHGILSVIGGGGGFGADSNAASGNYSTIGGGKGNIASGISATVGGGTANRASGDSSTVGGGIGNLAGRAHATVGGGQNDTASGVLATVGGGGNNIASGFDATVGGGGLNVASGGLATVGGGLSDTASGLAATVPGGNGNTASGSFSFAAGRRAKAGHDGTFVWGDGTDADFASTAANQFLIRAGNVGIGTTAPTKKLEVAGSIKVGTNDTIFSSNLSSNSPLSLQAPAGTTRVFVSDVSGNVGIGTTAPDQLLQIKNPGDNGAIIRIGANSTTLIDKRVRFGDGDFVAIGESPTQDDRMEIKGTNIYMITTGVGIGTATPAALLHVAGTAGNNTGVWSNLSDRRLKMNIEPIEGALETVERLQGVTFHWKDAQKDAQFGRVRGLIAQDVEKVIPEWIKTDPDGYKRLEPIGIDALLIEAIKQLKADNEELKTRISELEKGKPQAKVE